MILSVTLSKIMFPGQKLTLSVILILLTCFFILALTSLSQKSVTMDEIIYIPAGYSYLTTGDYRLNPETAPLIKLIAGAPLLLLKPHLPLDHLSWLEADDINFAHQLLYFQNNNTDRLVLAGRVPVILLGLLLGLIIYHFSSTLYGTKAGLFSLFLYTFSPTILSFTQLVSVDFGVTIFAYLAIFLLYLFLEKGGKNKHLLLAGLSLGLCVGSKHSGLLFFLVSYFLLFNHQFRKYYLLKERPTLPEIRNAKKMIKKYSLSLMIVALLALASLYHFTEIATFFKGLLIQLSHNQHGHPSYLLGQHSTQGWWYYFLIAFLVKTPLAIIIMLIIVGLGARKRGKKSFFNKEVYLLLPILATVLLSFTTHINIGLRYILPIYPFLFTFLGQFILLKRQNYLAKALLVGLPLWFLLANLSIYPDYLTYFNELAGGPSKGHRILIDSNLDWGQDLKQLANYMKTNHQQAIKLSYFGYDRCEYREITCEPLTCTPTTGFIGISINHLVGLSKEQAACFSWLRKEKPSTIIGNTIYLYQL